MSIKPQGNGNPTSNMLQNINKNTINPSCHLENVKFSGKINFVFLKIIPNCRVYVRIIVLFPEAEILTNLHT